VLLALESTCRSPGIVGKMQALMLSVQSWTQDLTMLLVGRSHIE
jgi:hypothetical protein